MNELTGLTLDRAIELVTEVVEERGEDFVYPEEWRDADRMCLYVHPDGTQPSCIVGAAFHKAGVTIEELRRFEAYSPWGLLNSFVAGEPDDYADMFLTVVQTQQDSGVSWGESLAAGLERVESRILS